MRRALCLTITVILGTGILAAKETDPTKDEQDNYDALKMRFKDNAQLGKPDPSDPKDPRLDVSEFLGTEGTAKLIASKDCPKGSPVDKVEIYATFRLVHWTGKGPSDAGGVLSTEDVDQEVKDRVKKITYHFAVAFDPAALGAGTGKLGKWYDAGLFYHEMMHGQLTLNRIKDKSWSGWDIACKCQKPNPDYIAKGVKAEDEEHKAIRPAQEKFVVEAAKGKENLDVQTATTIGVTGDKDDEGNRPFTIVIKIPDRFKEKDPIETERIVQENLAGEPDVKIEPDKGTVTITGKVKDDQTGRIVIAIDPPSIGMIMEVTELAPPPPWQAEELQPGILAALSRYWWLYLAGWLVSMLLAFARLRRKR